MEKEKKITKAGWFAVLSPFRWLLMSSIAFFLAAGTFNVPRYWIYAGIIFFGGIINAIIMIRLYPELANNRGKKQKGTKRWDLMLIIPYLLIIILIVPLIAGIDIGRFKWSYLEYPYLIIGVVLYIFANFIVQWAMITNKHFEGTVRIQVDRGHKVITTGPYKIVRHPGYLGMFITSISLPLILGSIYAFIPVGVSMIFLIIRTYMEDKTLQKELNGYVDFTEITKHRLLPFIW